MKNAYRFGAKINKYKIESINESMGQDFYKLEGRPRELMRSEIFLVN